MLPINSPYDSKDFFNSFAQMTRTQYSPNAAEEWHQLKPLFPDVTGKHVLDLAAAMAGIQNMPLIPVNE